MMSDKKRMKKLVLQGVFLCVWIIVAAMCITVTVFARERKSAKEVEAYYRTLEDDMVNRVRDILTKKGFENSGVMLTRVVEADESRSYTLSVHHGRILKLDEESEVELSEELEDLFFEEDQCTLRVCFW